MVKSGDLNGLKNYLAPAKDDELRASNFLVARVRLPSGVRAADVVVLAAGSDVSLPDSGVLVVPISRDANGGDLTIIAPGCGSIVEPLRVDQDTAVVARELNLEPVHEKDAASFTGRVLRADGKPAPRAIVRICDWGVTRADDEGRFRFTDVSPGSFLVRAEYPGGEYQEELTFGSGAELKRDLPLTAVTTVGIRWAVQRTEGSRSFVGDSVRTGEAYFSVKHSRFLLERGAETRAYWGSDFMLKDDLEGVRPYMGKEQLARLDASPPGVPFFWLFDATHYPTGLHAEKMRFEDIRAVNDGRPYEENTYFKFLRGELVCKGQVYTLRCVRKDCYAKMEITDVTIVPKQTSP